MSELSGGPVQVMLSVKYIKKKRKQYVCFRLVQGINRATQAGHIGVTAWRLICQYRRKAIRKW